MSQSLRDDSPRRQAAREFGRRLRRTMRARGIGQHWLVSQLGGSRSTLRQYLEGYNLPRLSQAERLAEGLADPALAEICRLGRTRACDHCGLQYVDPEGTPSRYCSERCRLIVRKRKGWDLGKSETRNRADRAERELLFARRQIAALEAAAEATEATTAAAFEAVAKMCHDCEPAGICRTKDCPLRPVSPLPLYRKPAAPQALAPAPGPYGTPENAARTKAAVLTALSRRWTPAARRKQSEDSRRFWAELGPAELAEQADRIRRGLAAGREARWREHDQ